MTVTLADLRRWNGLLARRIFLRMRLHKAVTAGKPTFSLKSQIKAIEAQFKREGFDWHEPATDDGEHPVA